MSEQNIHVLTEEERKAIRDKKINAISFGKDVTPKPPYALVNGALELNPEILLDVKKTDIINEDLEKDDSMFEYEPEYGEESNSKTEVVQKDTKLENNKIILDSNYDPATIKKYIKPKRNIFIRDLPTLKLPEDKNAIENNKIIEGKETITKEINTGTKEETKIVEKVAEVKTEPVVKPLVKVTESKTEPVLKPLVKVTEEKNEHVTLQVKVPEEKKESVIDQVKVAEVKTEPVVKPLVKVAEVKTEPVVKPLVKVAEEKNEHVTLQLKVPEEKKESVIDQVKVAEVNQEPVVKPLVKVAEEKNESVIEQVKVPEVKQVPVKPLQRVPLAKPLQRVPLARHDSAYPLVKTPEVIHEVTVNEVQKKEIENIAEVKIEEKDKSVNEAPVEIKPEAIENKVEEIKKDIVQEVSIEKKETAIDLEKPKDLVENVQKNDETIKVEQKQEEKIIEKPKTEISSIVPEVSNDLVLDNKQKQDITAETIKIEPIDDSKNIADKEIQTNTEIIDSKTQVNSTIKSTEKSVNEDNSFDLSDYKDENIIPIKVKNRKIKVLFSPKNIDSLIKTKQFREELEEIFRRIINNLESKHIKNLKQTKSDKIKELEKIKSILLSVISNKNISVKDKELVEHFLEDVLNHNSFYRKEIINALDNIEIVHPLKMLGFGGKVSLVKDVIEGKEINALIGNILSRIDNLIVYKRFEKRKIQKYYFAGEQDSKVNKIIHEFFNGNYYELADLAYKVRNEMDNYDENRQVFTKVVEKFVNDEEKYRDKLKNIKIKNLYTLSIIFDQIINPRYDMDAKMIYLETFNSKKKLIY